MKWWLVTVFVMVACVPYMDGQSPKSFNDNAIEFLDQGQHWEAIREFERARRSGGKQAAIARGNLERLRKQLDLPAHTLLHFGWKSGIGDLSSRLPQHTWLFASIMALISLIIISILNRNWNWTISLILLAFAVLCLILAQFRSRFVQSSELIVLTQDAELLERPYGSSDIKQTVFEGQMARVESEYEDYYFVQTDTYEHGWIARLHVAAIWMNQ